MRKHIEVDSAGEAPTCAIPSRAVHRALNRLQRNQDLKGLAWHVLFLTLYSFVVLDTLSVSQTYFQISAIENWLLDEEVQGGKGQGPFVRKTFHTVGSFEEYFDWVKGPLLSGIFVSEFYNGAQVTQGSQLVLPEGLSSNRVVGPIRFRTVRVVKNHEKYCSSDREDLLPERLAVISTCYPPFSEKTIDRAPFRGFAFEEGMSKVRGISGYGGEPVSGYGEDSHVFYLNTMKEVNGSLIPLTQEDALNIVEENLVKKLWGDKATRLLVVDFNLLSFNIGNVLTCRMAAEILPGGQWHVYWRMYPISLSPLRAKEWHRLYSKVALLLWSVLILARQVLSLWRRRWAVAFIFSSFWRFANLCNDILAVVVVSLLIHVEHVRFNESFVQAVVNADKEGGFVDIFEDARFVAYVGYLTCVNFLFAFLKLFNYLQSVSRLEVISRSLERALPELVSLVFTFAIMNTGFVLIGHLLFGSRSLRFHSILQSYSTLLRLTVGDFDYAVMYEANPHIAGPFYFLVLFFQFFILLNMFIAVITATYSASKEEAARERHEKAPVIVASRWEDYFDRLMFLITSLYYHGGATSVGKHLFKLLKHKCCECCKGKTATSTNTSVSQEDWRQAPDSSEVEVVHSLPTLFATTQDQLKLKLKMQQLKLDTNSHRIAIMEALERGAKRHSKHGFSLFESFDSTWMRLSPSDRKSVMGGDDILRLCCFDKSDQMNGGEADAESFIQHFKDLESELHPSMLVNDEDVDSLPAFVDITNFEVQESVVALRRDICDLERCLVEMSDSIGMRFRRTSVESVEGNEECATKVKSEIYGVSFAYEPIELKFSLVRNKMVVSGFVSSNMKQLNRARQAGVRLGDQLVFIDGKLCHGDIMTISELNKIIFESGGREVFALFQRPK